MNKRGPKPIPEAMRRKHGITCRLTDAELERLRQGKPPGMSIGEWLRTRALNRQLPKTIPEINQKAWANLARAHGNLAAIATAMRSGEFVQIWGIRATVDRFRLALIGANFDERDAEN